MDIVERYSVNTGQEWLQTYFKSMIDIITPYVRGKILLDAGCGSGYGSYTWAINGAKIIDAYDISSEALKSARQYFNHPCINFERKNFNTAVFKKNHYDICISMEVLEHVKRYRFHLKQIHLSLKKGGILFLTTPNGALTTNNNIYHLKELTYTEAVDLLQKNGFKIIKSLGFNNNITSVVANKLTVRQFIPVIKSLPFYSLVIKTFFKPRISTAERSLGMFFICMKV